MKYLKYLAILLLAVAYGWMPAAMSTDKEAAAAGSRAAEYVYLHQTRNGSNALQNVSDRSRLQCNAH